MNLQELAQEDKSQYQKPDEEIRQSIRNKIHSDVADDSSLLGTTADAVQMLLYELSKFSAQLNAVQSLAEVRDASQSLNDLLGSFATKVDVGAVKLPYQAKGIENAISEIEARATAVTDVLTSNG